MTPKSFGIVIPALNEYPGIIEVLQRLKEVASTLVEKGLYDTVDILVVDDGSTDETAAAVRSVESVRLLQFEKNRGYGAALKAGFATLDCQHLAFLDADGTYPPEAFPQLCEALINGEADIIVGSRLSGAPSDMPAVRYWGNRIFAFLTSISSGVPVKDCASGMRVFKKEILPRIYPLSDGLDFTPAMTTRALMENLSIKEIPITYHERSGQSKLNAVKDGFRFLDSILRITVLYNPLKFFGIFALAVLILGIVYSVAPVLHYIKFNEVPEWYIYRLLAILVFWLAGLQILTLGILANFSLAIIHKQITDKSRVIRYFVTKQWWNRLDLYGLVMIAMALTINARNIWHYFTHGKVNGHWSAIVVGAILILTGIQFFSVHLLLRILANLRNRDELIEKDLRAPH